jgi:hypothetical protein
MNPGARPKHISDAIPVLVAAVSPIPLFVLAWWPVRPIRIDDDSISILAIGMRLRSIEWKDIKKIERITYVSRRTKSRKTIIKIYTDDGSIVIYDFIDSFWNLKQCLREATASMTIPKFDVDKTKAGATIPNGAILDS